MHNNHRQQFTGILFGLFQIISLVGITPGGPPTLKWIAFAALTWISYHLITTTTTGDPRIDLGLGNAILSHLFIMFDLMLLTHPNSLQNFQDSHSGKITNRPFKQRVVWAFSLYTNPRGIGWAHASRHLPSSPSPSTPRWKFVLVRIRRALLYIMLEFIAFVLNASNPGLTTPGVLLSQSAFRWRALGVVGFGAAGFAQINWVQCLFSAGVVACGFSAPERWPYMFGSPLQAWSVQQFWRKVWHQMLRKPAIGCASITASKIISPNSSHGRLANLSKIAHNFLWLCTVFFMVGFVHVGGEYMLLGRFGSGALKFFVLQPVAITMEKVLASGWAYLIPPPTGVHNGSDTRTERQNRHNGVKLLSPKTSGERSRSNPEKIASEPPIWLRCVGYVWVFLWFAWSLAFMVDAMVPLGIFIDPRVDLRTLRLRDFRLQVMENI